MIHHGRLARIGVKVSWAVSFTCWRRVPGAPIAIIAVVVLASFLSGHPGMIALVPVLVFLIARRLAGGRAPR